MSAQGERRSRVAVIGLDGASLPLLRRLADEGTMPNLASLLAKGPHGVLESVIPTNSIAAWSSFMTGQRPDQHGAFSFLVRHPDDFNVKQIVNSTYLRGNTLWELLSAAGSTVGVYNVPLTFPVRPVNGFLVSGLMTPSVHQVFTHPTSLTSELLAEFPDYTLDVGWMRYDGRVRELVDDLIAMTRQRVHSMRYLLARYDPDFTICVFVSPDRIQHALWRYIDPAHPSYDERQTADVMPEVRRYYRELDDAVGETIDLLGAGVDLFVMSDHGFHSNARQVLLNEWLAQEHLLRWRSSGRRSLQQTLQVGKRFLRKRVGKGVAARARKALRQHASFSDETAIDWSTTKVYSTWETQQGLSVNLQGREPSGIVSRQEFPELVERTAERLRNWRDPETNQLVISEVRVAEGSPYGRSGADILAMPAADYAFSRYSSRLFGSTGWASGGHSLDGVWMAYGPRIDATARPGPARIFDLAPTILHLMGQAVPTFMSGRVLTELIDPGFMLNNPVRQSDLELAPAGVAATEYSSEDEAEIEKRLQSLGYM